MKMYRAKKETIIRNKAKEDISEHLQEKGISAEELMPEAEPDELAYKIDDKYFVIQRTEEGYDYTFYAFDYDGIDGGVYDNPDISMRQAMEDILENENMSLKNVVPVDYEDLMAEVEEADERRMQLTQLLKNCPPSIFEDYDREKAVNTCEGIAIQFTKSKGYLTVQSTEEGYFYIFYDSDLDEIKAGDYDDPDISVQKATYEILKSERMDDMECIKVNYKKFEAKTIQHSKDLLQSGELRATSEIGRNEADELAVVSDSGNELVLKPSKQLSKALDQLYGYDFLVDYCNKGRYFILTFASNSYEVKTLKGTFTSDIGLVLTVE